jgi:very-short-patch-repair endonuclease
VKELELLAAVTAAGLPAPVLGLRVRVGGRTYKLDLAWPEWRIALEYDGWATHSSVSAFHADRDRSRRIEAQGWHVLHVTSKTDLVELVGDVRALIALSGHRAATVAAG